MQNDFWEIFSALFSALGAVATAAAVFVALWQTKYHQLKKLKLKFSNTTTVFSPDLMDAEAKLVTLTIVNVGNRPVVIEKWGMVHHKKDHHSLFISPANVMGFALNPSLPKELPCEIKLDLFLERDKFLNLLKKGVEQKELKARRKIKLYVVDSTGKVFTVKSKKTVKTMLDENNTKTNKKDEK